MIQKLHSQRFTASRDRSREFRYRIPRPHHQVKRIPTTRKGIFYDLGKNKGPNHRNRIGRWVLLEGKRHAIHLPLVHIRRPERLIDKLHFAGQAANNRIHHRKLRPRGRHPDQVFLDQRIAAAVVVDHERDGVQPGIGIDGRGHGVYLRKCSRGLKLKIPVIIPIRIRKQTGESHRLVDTDGVFVHDEVHRGRRAYPDSVVHLEGIGTAILRDDNQAHRIATGIGVGNRLVGLVGSSRHGGGSAKIPLPGDNGIDRGITHIGKLHLQGRAALGGIAGKVDVGRCDRDDITEGVGTPLGIGHNQADVVSPECRIGMVGVLLGGGGIIPKIPGPRYRPGR